MRLFATFFAQASMASVRADKIPIEGHQFSVNLLTEDCEMSVTSPWAKQSIHWNNATMKHVLFDKTYSIVGGLLFNETDNYQTYEVHTDLWNKTVDITLKDVKDQQHVDFKLSKDGNDGMGLKFEWLSGWGTEIDNVAREG